MTQRGLVSIVAWVLAAAILTVATPASAEVRRVAVVIGANIGDDDETPLKFAERDAQRVGTVLRELGGVTQDDLVLLLGPNADTVELTLESTFRKLHRSGDEIILFVYYSGHADSTAIHLGGTRLPLARLRATLEDAPADVKVMVLDACRSGEVTRVKGAVPAEPFELDSAEWDVGEGIAIITSAASGEDAQESDRIEGSFFTHHFVSGLLGAADTTGDGVVTLSEAYEYAYRETLRSTSRARSVQHPTYAFDIRGRRDLAVTAPRQKFEGMGRLALSGPGSYVVFAGDAQGPIVAEIRIDDPREIALAEGSYFVRRRHRGNVFEVDADVRQKHRTAVDPAHMRRISTGQVARKGSDPGRAAWGIVGGAGVSGEVLRDTASIPHGVLGVQIDMSAVSLQLRGRFGLATANEQFLASRQDVIGADLTGLSVFDIGKFFVGGGLRVGADFFIQSFPEASTEPTRRSAAGRGSALVTIGYALTGWLSLYVEPSFDMYLMNVAGAEGESTIGFRYAPSGMLGLGVYL